MSSTVTPIWRDRILLVRLDDPSGFPRLTQAVLRQLHPHFDKLAVESSATPGVKAVVIAGTDRAFATGADLAEVSALNGVTALPFSALGQDLMNKIERCPVPVVAAIRGHCLGGGFDLAMACHLRIAAADATFGHPGGSLGIITGWGGTQRLPRIIGKASAMEMLTTGRIIDAMEALAWRLVGEVVQPETTLDVALARARTLAGSDSA